MPAPELSLTAPSPRGFRFGLPQARAGRALVWFWIALLVLVTAGALLLLWLGPIEPRALPAGVSVERRPAVLRRTIPAPDPALLEAGSIDATDRLPRISAAGLTSSTLYASPQAPPPVGSTRIAILLDGVGLSSEDSLHAIDRLPAAVSLAVSPYSADPEPILRAARRVGHEFLLSLPMEPDRSPLDDEGGMQLSTIAAPEDNARHLEWSLSRIQGYAGITNQAAGLSGDRYAKSLDFDALAASLAARGLFYIDASPNSDMPDAIAGARADLQISGPIAAAELDAKLQQLENMARAKGDALAVIGPLYPVTIERLDAWTHALAERGLVLVPVSQLVHRAEGDQARSGQP